MALEEGDDVATLATAKAVEDLAVGLDVEGRSLLAVEGTQTLQVAAGLLQLYVPANQADDAGSWAPTIWLAVRWSPVTLL